MSFALSAWVTASLSLGVVGLSLGLVSAVLAAWHWSAKESTDEISEEREMVSMVALFKQLPVLDETVLANFAERAWDITFEIGDDAQTFVAGCSPLFVIKTDKRLYTVNHTDSPYFENVDEVVGEVAEMRMRHVLENHQSWISIDLISEPSDTDLSEEYALIGQLLNQFLHQDGLAILIPQQMRLIPWDKSVESALVGSNPLKNLSSANAPVIPVEDNNPKMLAAVECARAKWPQFESAFEAFMRDEHRDESRKFSVKTQITYGGRTEYIWMIVTSIENQIIYGTLANQPVALGNLAAGDRVRVSVGQLSDWVYPDGGLMIGGFTIKVLSDQANQKANEKKMGT
ncbi:MAG: DUF2314 domain-containing protein [Mariniblastus sp.]|nr:DUF2314 domain-containing protein [Mariniblastus sp.]